MLKDVPFFVDLYNSLFTNDTERILAMFHFARRSQYASYSSQTASTRWLKEKDYVQARSGDIMPYVPGLDTIQRIVGSRKLD
jgi:hypothetical protein